MRQLVEKQLSWLTLFMTAFSSLLANCRGHNCGQEELARCAATVQKISNDNLNSVTKKEELDALCPELRAGMECIKTYTTACMRSKQRENFNSLYEGTHQAIRELCQDGPYQDNFLKHSHCMQKVQVEYEQCFNRYQDITQKFNMENQTGSVESICCGFQEFLDCSHRTVHRVCGEDAAKFTKSFLDRMSNQLIKQCHYKHGECKTNGIGSIFRIDILLPMILILLGRYFT